MNSSVKTLQATQLLSRRDDLLVRLTRAHRVPQGEVAPDRDGSADHLKAFRFPGARCRVQNRGLVGLTRLSLHTQILLHAQTGVGDHYSVPAPFRGPLPLPPCDARARASRARTVANDRKRQVPTRALLTLLENVRAAKANPA